MADKSFPMHTAAELTNALDKMPGLWLAVGVLRAQQRRCKVGSKKYEQISASILRAEVEAMEFSSMLRMDIGMRSRAERTP